jgi:tetratricopeptide (TPR) repeat protein
MKARSVKHVFVIAITLISCFSCTEKQKDSSLSVKEYIELGVPDPNKQWVMDDFLQAYSVLARIKWDRPFELPAKDSKKSGLLFDHLLSLENMSFLKDTSMSLNEKAERISEFSKVYEYWMDVYTNPVIKKNYYHRELIDIQLFNLRLTEVMLNLAQEINKSDDPADAALKYGYESIKMNYLTALNNDLKTQSNTSQFLKMDLDRMADSVCASVMRNKDLMDSSAVIELKQSLRLVTDSTSSDYIRSKYNSLAKSF